MPRKRTAVIAAAAAWICTTGLCIALVLAHLEATPPLFP